MAELRAIPTVPADEAAPDWWTVVRPQLKPPVWDALKGLGLDPVKDPETGAPLRFKDRGSYAVSTIDGVHGDALAWIRIATKCSYPAAIARLAEIVGISPDVALASWRARFGSTEGGTRWQRRRRALVQQSEQLVRAIAATRDSDALLDQLIQLATAARAARSE